MKESFGTKQTFSVSPDGNVFYLHIYLETHGENAHWHQCKLPKMGGTGKRFVYSRNHTLPKLVGIVVGAVA